MPFFTHLDLLTDYRVASITAIEHRLPVNPEGGIYCFSVLHYFHSAVLWFFSLIFPYLKTIWFSPWGSVNDVGMTTFSNWSQFVGNRFIFLTLFLLKTPYFIFDFLTFWALLPLFSEKTSQIRFTIFWMLNPIGIFVTYIFGRYEIIPVFFIALSLQYFKKVKPEKAAIFLGIALVMKLYALLLIPFFAFSCSEHWKERIKFAFLVLTPGLIMIAIAFISGHFLSFSGFTTLPHNDYLLGLKLLIHPNNEQNYVDIIFLFISFYTFFVFYAEREAPNWQNFAINSFIILQLLFAFSFFHPHYYFWLLPFWVIIFDKNRYYRMLFGLQLLLLVIYSFHWMRPLFGYLCMPIAPHFFSSLNSPYEIINSFYPAEKFINLARSAFTGITIWLIFLVLKLERKNVAFE